MPLKDSKYKYNQTIISVIGCENVRKIRVVTMGCLRTSGIEEECSENSSFRGEVNDEKLVCNLSRTKRKIYELAMCNPWKYFFTGTLDAKKYKRDDLENFIKDFTRWLRNTSRKHGSKIQYLIIPELHHDGKSWHIHGFLMGLSSEYLEQFKVGMKMGKYLAQKVKKGEIIYNWPDYAKKFGFCDLEPIKNHEACAKYVTKYITKELAYSVTELNAHQYYCSQGLSRAQVVKKGTMLAGTVPFPDYVGDYCSVSEFAYSPELLNELVSSFVSDDILSENQKSVKFGVLPDWYDTPWDSGSLPSVCFDSTVSSCPSWLRNSGDLFSELGLDS